MWQQEDNVQFPGGLPQGLKGGQQATKEGAFTHFFVFLSRAGQPVQTHWHLQAVMDTFPEYACVLLYLVVTRVRHH